MTTRPAKYVRLGTVRLVDGRGYLFLMRDGACYWGRYSAKGDSFIDKDAKLAIPAGRVDGYWE